MPSEYGFSHCRSSERPPSIAGVSETVVKEPIFHGQVHVYTAGRRDAPTVVLVHGIGDKGARDWEGLTATLAQDFHVVSFDLPGFGRSSKGNQSYTPENYVAILRHYIAGSRIVGSESALVAPRQSEILFSVSRVQSPHFRGSLHELRTVAPGNPL